MVSITYNYPLLYWQWFDSSVGGKTAIDTPYGKNLIGTFWQPKQVIADISCLTTLPKKQRINGLIEAVKMFLTHDRDSLFYLEKNLDAAVNGDLKVLAEIIYCAVKIKAGVVAQDEKEAGMRMVLNFGHTIGHALEILTDYKILHGTAVALGILVEAKIAELSGLLSATDYRTITNLLARLGFSKKALGNFNVGHIIKATLLDKKTKANQARYVLLNGLGSVHSINNHYAHPINDALVKQALSQLYKSN